MSELNISEIEKNIINYNNEKTRLDEIAHSLMVRKTGLMSLLENNKDDTLKLHLEVINESFKKEELTLAESLDKLELDMQVLQVFKMQIKDKLKTYLNLLQNIDSVLTSNNILDKNDITDSLVTEIASNIYPNCNKSVSDEFIKREKEYHPKDSCKEDISLTINKKVIRVNNDTNFKNINVVKSSNEYNSYSEYNKDDDDYSFFHDKSF